MTIIKVFRNNENPIVLCGDGKSFMLGASGGAVTECPFVLRFVPTKMGYLNGVWYASRNRDMVVSSPVSRAPPNPLSQVVSSPVKRAPPTLLSQVVSSPVSRAPPNLSSQVVSSPVSRAPPNLSSQVVSSPVSRAPPNPLSQVVHREGSSQNALAFQLPPLLDYCVHSQDSLPLLYLLNTEGVLETYQFTATGLESLGAFPGRCSQISVAGSRLIVCTDSQEMHECQALEGATLLPSGAALPSKIYQRSDGAITFTKMLYTAQQLSRCPDLGSWDAAHYGQSDSWFDGERLIFTCTESVLGLFSERLAEISSKPAVLHSAAEFFTLYQSPAHRWLLSDSGEDRYYFLASFPPDIQSHDGYFWLPGSSDHFYDSFTNLKRFEL